MAQMAIEGEELQDGGQRARQVAAAAAMVSKELLLTLAPDPRASSAPGTPRSASCSPPLYETLPACGNRVYDQLFFDHTYDVPKVGDASEYRQAAVNEENDYESIVLSPEQQLKLLRISAASTMPADRSSYEHMVMRGAHNSAPTEPSSPARQRMKDVFKAPPVEDRPVYARVIKRNSASK